MTDKEPNKQKQQPAMREKRLLLLVDGNAAQAFYTSILLQRLDYNIFAAKTAEDAIEIMRITAPSLVLTEISLPGMGGIKLLDHIKKDPRTAAVPVIIYTGTKNPEDEKRCLQAGCARYLARPADPNTLYATIQSLTEAFPRQFIRCRTCLSVIEEDEPSSEGEPVDSCITFLSENGLFLNTENPQSPGTLIPIIFYLKHVKIKTEGIVLYSFSKGSRPYGEPGMGVKFAKISDEDRGLIRIFLVDQITQNITPPKGSGPSL